jgi:hypothetical protein
LTQINCRLTLAPFDKHNDQRTDLTKSHFAQLRLLSVTKLALSIAGRLSRHAPHGRA